MADTSADVWCLGMSSYLCWYFDMILRAFSLEVNIYPLPSPRTAEVTVVDVTGPVHCG